MWGINTPIIKKSQTLISTMTKKVTRSGANIIWNISFEKSAEEDGCLK